MTRRRKLVVSCSLAFVVVLVALVAAPRPVHEAVAADEGREQQPLAGAYFAPGYDLTAL